MINKNNNSKTLWFLFYKDELLLRNVDEKPSIPCGDTPPLPSKYTQHTVAKLSNIPCIAYYLDEQPTLEGYTTMALRDVYEHIDKKYYKIAGKALEILYWDKNTQYCPACGTKTQMNTPISKKCPNCGKEIFTIVTPAILVRIKKDDKIMLVHSRTFKKNYKGLVAGFVETGESLEECVRREVMEETSLTIKNIKYFGSQPWPYPSNIMIGFTADYESGEVHLQDEELSSGGFFGKDNLPLLPRKDSLARKIIDDWINS